MKSMIEMMQILNFLNMVSKYLNFTIPEALGEAVNRDLGIGGYKSSFIISN